MDTRQGNKLTSQVEADTISVDSLSFSGLVCIQDQQPQLLSTNQAKLYQVSKIDPEFEFTSTKANLNSAVNPIKITPADQLISNGQLQTTKSMITNPPSKMSRGKTGSAVKYEQLGKASKHTNKQSTMTRTGFGQKMKSFLSPCRECRTTKPDAVKAQTVQGENFKIY